MPDPPSALMPVQGARVGADPELRDGTQSASASCTAEKCEVVACGNIREARRSYTDKRQRNRIADWWIRPVTGGVPGDE